MLQFHHLSWAEGKMLGLWTVSPAWKSNPTPNPVDPHQWMPHLEVPLSPPLWPQSILVKHSRFSAPLPPRWQHNFSVFFLGPPFCRLKALWVSRLSQTQEMGFPTLGSSRDDFWGWGLLWGPLHSPSESSSRSNPKQDSDTHLILFFTSILLKCKVNN